MLSCSKTLKNRYKNNYKKGYEKTKIMSRSYREAHPEVNENPTQKPLEPTLQKNQQEPLQWFAARTRKGQELAIREALKKLEIDHFLPTRTETRQLKYRKKKVETPLIRNIIFIHATKQQACDIPNLHGIKLFYIISLQTRKMLVVPDKQMQDFIYLTTLSPDNLLISEEKQLTVGTKVKVTKGNLAGIEGTLTTIDNNTYVTLSLKGILTATVKVPKSYLKVVEE